MNFNVSPDAVILVVVAALSLFFDYFPGLSTWFDNLEVPTKKLITVGLASLVAVAVFVGTCYGIFVTNLSCTLVDAWTLLYGVILAVSAMYGFHKATKPGN